MLNRVSVMGRLTHDPELKQTQSGSYVATFSIAVERDFKDKASGEKVVDFFDVAAWRQTAEFVCKYFSKGRMMVVDGRLQARIWEDRNGSKRKAVEIVADSVYFGDSKRDAEGTGYQQGAPPSSGWQQPSYSGGSYPADEEGFTEMEGNDLPF